MGFNGDSVVDVPVTLTIVPVPGVNPATPYSTTKDVAVELQLTEAELGVIADAKTLDGSKQAGNAELTTSSISNTNLSKVVL